MTKGVVLLPLLWATLTSAQLVGDIFDCPQPWVAFEDKCYKFEMYSSTLDEARLDCNNNGANLVSVNSAIENNFITSWLEDNDLTNRQWYTSGKRDSSDKNAFFWQGDGTVVEGEQYWLSETHRKKDEEWILYATEGAGWGWTLGSRATQGNQLERPYICEIRRSHVYRITEEERGYEYGTLETNPERFEKGPHFTRAPTDIMFKENSPDRFISLDCEAEGNPLPTYEWYIEKDQQRKRIDPKAEPRYTVTNGKLTIQEPSSTVDNGNYQCVATNKFGSILSHRVQLKFTYLQDFTNSARDPVRVNSYEGAGIECNPPKHGYRTLLFSWSKDGLFVRPDRKPYLFVSGNGKLYFSHATTVDEGDYFCHVHPPDSLQAAEGKISRPIQLIVTETIASEREPNIASGFPAVFPDSPKLGDDVRIECFAWGTDELTYRWTREGLAMPKGHYFTDHNRVLHLPDIENIDVGMYKCSVSRLNGLSDEGVVTLDIAAVPFFTIPLPDQHVDKNSNLEWVCNADGIPTVNFKWYRNATELVVGDLLPEDASRYTIQNSVLKISEVDSIRDSGMYQCSAANTHGTRFSAAQLRVLSFPPSFAKHPLRPNQYATQGGNTTLICKPEGAPSPTITWFKNGSPLSTDGTRVIKLPNGNLLINNVRTDDKGTFLCRAENELGTAESAGNLTILSRTAFTKMPPPRTTIVNKTTFFPCEVSFNPLLDVTYEWFHNTRQVEFIRIKHIGERIIIERDKHYKRGTGVNRGALYITRTQFEHAGDYTCVAKTTTDTVTAKDVLTVIGPPTQPAGVYGMATTATSIDIMWGESFAYGRQITSALVEGYNEHEKIWRRLKTNIKGEDLVNRRTTIIGLMPYSTYKFRVSVESSLGISKPSQESSEYRTMEAKPIKYPSNVGGGGGKVGTVVMEWDPMPREEWNSKEDDFGYRVYWKEHDYEDDQWEHKDLKGPYHYRHVETVGTDNFYKRYDVKVQSMNKMGLGPEPPVVTIYSAMNIPSGVATNIRSSPFNATALLVEWDPVEDNRANLKGVLSGYRINYWMRGEDEEMALYRTIPGQTDNGLIVGLYPWTYYTVNIQVFNTAGYGPKSQDFEEHTLRAAPLYAPTEVKIEMDGSTSVEVVFRGVSTSIEEEPLEGYMIRYWRQGENLYVAKDVDCMRKTHKIVEGLEQDVLYNVRVYGYSRGGQGLMSSPTKQFILGRNCYVTEDTPDKEYVYKCRGETDAATSVTLSLLSMCVCVFANLLW